MESRNLPWVPVNTSVPCRKQIYYKRGSAEEKEEEKKGSERGRETSWHPRWQLTLSAKQNNYRHLQICVFRHKHSWSRNKRGESWSSASCHFSINYIRLVKRKELLRWRPITRSRHGDPIDRNKPEKIYLRRASKWKAEPVPRGGDAVWGVWLTFRGRQWLSINCCISAPPASDSTARSKQANQRYAISPRHATTPHPTPITSTHLIITFQRVQVSRSNKKPFFIPPQGKWKGKQVAGT